MKLNGGRLGRKGGMCDGIDGGGTMIRRDNSMCTGGDTRRERRGRSPTDGQAVVAGGRPQHQGLGVPLGGQGHHLGGAAVRRGLHHAQRRDRPGRHQQRCVLPHVEQPVPPLRPRGTPWSATPPLRPPVAAASPFLDATFGHSGAAGVRGGSGSRPNIPCACLPARCAVGSAATWQAGKDACQILT